ncbi:unnamed protein product, partial [Ilex paraguariensis]
DSSPMEGWSYKKNCGELKEDTDAGNRHESQYSPWLSAITRKSVLIERLHQNDESSIKPLPDVGDMEDPIPQDLSLSIFVLGTKSSEFGYTNCAASENWGGMENSGHLPLQTSNPVVTILIVQKMSANQGFRTQRSGKKICTGLVATWARPNIIC